MYNFTVKPDGGEPYEVKATTRDVLRWEKSGRSGSRSMTAMQDEQKLSDLYEIAFYAAKREGLFDGKREDFENNVDLDLAGRTVVLDADPTQSAASTDD